jgi:hypothetical protein
MKRKTSMSYVFINLTMTESLDNHLSFEFQRALAGGSLALDDFHVSKNRAERENSREGQNVKE